MKLVFDTTYFDTLIFSIVQQFKSWIMQVITILFFLYMFLSEIGFNINDNDPSPFSNAAITAFGWYIGLGLFQFGFNVLYLYSRNNKSVITKHIVEVRDDSFYEETKYIKSYYYWNGINKLVQSPGYIYVYVTAHTAIIVPNKVFETSGERKSFYQQLLLKKNNA